MNILSIETSCDDTSVAIVNNKKEILSHITYNQIQEHKEYKGVVPEVAARSHILHLQHLVNNALGESGIKRENLTAIAATSGPGLIGGVMVGCCFAKAMASALKLPFLAINHLEGHALTMRLVSNIEYPYLLLLVSGGHCMFVDIRGLGEYEILGQSLDDSVGECFDKVARMMGLEYPGGPIIEQMAKNGTSSAYKLPIPMVNAKGCDMSFSGLKTSCMQLIKSIQALSIQNIQDISCCLQEVIAKSLANKAKYAIETSGRNKMVISGGVAANRFLLKYLQDAFAPDVQILAPEPKLCTDNAAMIAWAAIERFNKGYRSDLNFCPKPRWPLNEIKL